jgi:NADH-quinone oxidoreductase subunit L
MTAFYMFRLVYLTFFGESRMSQEAEHHVHESPKSMTVPLIVLAICSVFAGYLGVPHALGGSNRFEKYLEPVFHPAGHELVVAGEGEKVAEAAAGEAHESSTEYLLMFLSVAAAGVGWFLASRAYGKAGKGYIEPIQKAAAPVYSTLLNKYYVDEAYDYVFTGRRKLGPFRLGAQGLGDAMFKFDANIVDGGVNGAGWATRFSGTVSSWWDKWIIDGVLVNGPAIVARVMSYPARMLQWGLVQWYALVMVGGLVGFILYYVLR